MDPVPARTAPAAYRADPYAADPRPAQAALWRIESLRTTMTIVGLLALIAIGLAVWALVRTRNEHPVTHRAPVAAASLSTLNSRVNHLSDELRALGSSSGTRSATTQTLATRIAALEQAQRRLSSQVAGHGSSSQSSQLASRESTLAGQVSQLAGKEAALSGKVTQLEGRVARLAGQLNGQSTTGTGTGTSTTP